METVNDEMTKTSRFSQFMAKLRDPVYKNKFICTLFLFWAFVFLGLGVGLGGPSFLDLMLITNTELEQASTLFTAGAVGYMVGALASGVMYDKCNKLLLLAVVTIGTSICTGVRPLCTSLPVMVAVTFLGSFFAAGIDTGGNADLIRLWGREGKSFMQTLHFCFALGGLMAPLIVEPFLAPKWMHASQSGIMNASLWEGNDTFMTEPMAIDTSMDFRGPRGLNDSWNQTSAGDYETPTSRILIAYLIVGGVGISAAIPFFVEFFLRTVDKNRKPEDEFSSPVQKMPLVIYIVTVFMIGTFFFTYVAIEESFISFLTVFTVDGLKWHKADGTLVTSVFWGSFAACRFLGIFFIHFLAPKKMLLVCLVLLIVSLFVFLLSSILVIHVGIWVSSVGVGFAASIVFPTAFTWIEEHVIKVTGKITSAIMLSTSSASIASPVLLGYLMHKVTYMTFTYLVFAQAVFLLIIYVILNVYSKVVIKKYHRPNKSDTGNKDQDKQDSVDMI